MRRRGASQEKKKELAFFNQKLAELEAKKAARFLTNASFVYEKTLGESHIRQIFIQGSKLKVSFVNPYFSLNYTQYQTFVRECKHVFWTRPTTYRKEIDNVLYGIGALEGTLLPLGIAMKRSLAGWILARMHSTPFCWMTCFLQRSVYEMCTRNIERQSRDQDKLFMS